MMEHAPHDHILDIGTDAPCSFPLFPNDGRIWGIENVLMTSRRSYLFSYLSAAELRDAAGGIKARRGEFRRVGLERVRHFADVTVLQYIIQF